MKFELIATCKQYLFDTETPIAIYLKLREHFSRCILLENSEKGKPEDQCSYICVAPIAGITVSGLAITTYLPGMPPKTEYATSTTQVLPHLLSFFLSFTISDLPSEYHFPGMFGYTTYDAVRYFENIEIPLNEDTAIPDIQYDLYRYVIVIERLKNKMRLITTKGKNEAPLEEGIVESILNNKNIPVYPFKITSLEKRNCTDEFYIDAVEKGIQHCYRGDVFQVVLSRSFSIDFEGDNFNVYRALRSINPSPYLFYLDYNSFQLFGSSPESQLKIDSKKASIHPIAGTYKRTGDLERDHLLAGQLKEDLKENAEHIMLVDLARNDLSKHYQKVSVAEYRKIEMYSHVIHLVSIVEGKDPVTDVHQLQVLADTFPAGTLSGAPKYRAMNIIKDIENSPRGFYGGCVGFVGFDGTLNTAIMIRSFLSKDNILYYQAGAGITASSIPEKELQEINNKIGALRNALTLANTL